MSEEAQQSGDVGSAVFVESVEADEGIQQQHLGLEGSEGLLERLAILLQVEAQTGCGDHVQVELVETQAAMLAQLVDAIPHGVQCVLGQVGDHGPRGIDLEALEAGGAGSHGDGHLQPEPGFAGFGRSPDDADGGRAPQVLYEPGCLGGLLLDGMYREGVEGRGHGARALRASTTCPEAATVAPLWAACSRALRASRSRARRLPWAISKRAS